MKDKEIYFLIEHQSSVDYAMSFRLEEYKLEIMRSAIDKKKVKTKEYEIPTVIPIVIYTGKEKWTVKRELNKVQDERLEKLNLQQYNLIDVNKYKEEELLKSDNFVDKVFLMEKMKSGEELTNVIPIIVNQVNEGEDKNNLIKIIRVMLKEKIGEEKIEELIKEMEGEDEDMLACVEMLREENKRIRAEGIEEGKRIIINNMLKVGKNIKEMEGEDEDMLACVEMLREENKRIRAEGRAEGIKQNKIEIIKEMLKLGVNKEIICKTTKIKEEELKKIQKDNV